MKRINLRDYYPFYTSDRFIRAARLRNPPGHTMEKEKEKDPSAIHSYCCLHQYEQC